MAYFQISKDSGSGEFLASLEADGIEDAASKYVRTLKGRNGCQRMTGEPGKSGCFHVTYRTQGNAATTLGPVFHVRQEF